MILDIRPLQPGAPEQAKISPLKKWYRNHIKGYGCIRDMVATLLSLQPIVIRLRNKAYPLLKTDKFQPIQTVSSQGVTCREIFSGEKVKVPVAVAFPQNAGFEFPATEYAFPAVSVAALQDATIYGATHFISCRNAILTHDLADIRHDYFVEELRSRLVVDEDKHKAFWLRHEPCAAQLAEAAVFTDAWAGNYAHFLTEVLPRIALFCSLEEYKTVPLVIDTCLHKNLMEAISLVTDSGRVIHTLARDRRAEVKMLHAISYLGHVPFEWRGNTCSHDGRFSPAGLTHMLMRLDAVIVKTPRALAQKIYIKRNSGMRNLHNQEEVEALLVAEGFSIVEPEKLSFAEQYILFSHADVVVGGTGAAMANLIFCKPEAKIVIMLAHHYKMPYGYWRSMAAATGKSITYVLGRIVGFWHSFHADYVIDTDTLRQALTSDGKTK